MEIETVLYSKRKRKTRKKNKWTGEKIYSRSEWEEKFWDVFSKFIRTRDGWECVMKRWPGHTCSGLYLQAGHVIPRGKRAIKYDERQVFAQCSGSNKNHVHWPQEYTAWFIETHGANLYLELKNLARKEAKAPSIKECQRLIALYEKKTANL